MMLKMLGINEIKKGMRVNVQQLDIIYNTYILLGNTEAIKDDTDIGYHTEGEILFIGEKQNDEYAKAWESNNNITVVFNVNDGSDDIEDGDYIGDL